MQAPGKLLASRVVFYLVQYERPAKLRELGLA